MSFSVIQIHGPPADMQFLTWGESKVLNLRRMDRQVQKYGAPPEVSKHATWLVLKMTVSMAWIFMSMNRFLTIIWKLNASRMAAAIRLTSRVTVMRVYSLWKWSIFRMNMSVPMTLRLSAAHSETAPYSVIDKWDSIGHWLRVIPMSRSSSMEQRKTCRALWRALNQFVTSNVPVSWAVPLQNSLWRVMRPSLNVEVHSRASVPR